MLDTKIPVGGLQVRLAECHDTCLDVEGPNGHICNVNPIAHTDPQEWRVDCDDCFTCVTAGVKTKKEALDAAKEHVKVSVEEFRNNQYGSPYPAPCEDCGAAVGVPCQTGCPTQD